MEKTDWTDSLTIHKEPVPHIRWDEIEAAAPKEEFAALDKWMGGQTMALLQDGTAGIFPWDFDRWKRQGRKQKQGKDWD